MAKCELTFFVSFRLGQIGFWLRVVAIVSSHLLWSKGDERGMIDWMDWSDGVAWMND